MVGLSGYVEIMAAGFSAGTLALGISSPWVFAKIRIKKNFPCILGRIQKYTIFAVNKWGIFCPEHEHTMKTGILSVIIMALSLTQGWAMKVKTLPRTLRNYPSGTIDEYHFRPGYVVVRGCVKNVPQGKYGTLGFVGMDMFLDKEFVEAIKVDSTGRFCASILVPHSQFFTLGSFGSVFAAVGDTLDVTIEGRSGTEGDTAVWGGTGATGEVNRLWPRLRRQFFSDDMEKKPWEAKDRQVMMEWRGKKLKEFRAVVGAVDADTLSLIDGCSDFARDVLKSSLLARIPEQIGAAFSLYRWNIMDEQRNTPPEKVVRRQEVWNFLHECEPYILDNPCMLFADGGSHLINNLEFDPLDAFIYLGDEFYGESGSQDPDRLADYKENLVLPSTYDRQDHEKMLEYRQGRLLSVADYYRMAGDSICSRLGLHNNFMMQICLLHEIMRDAKDASEAWFPHTLAERFAGAIPQFAHKIVAHRAVDAYRKFVAGREGRRPEASASPEGDALFSALVEKYKGNVLFMDFWGISCGPCRSGMLDQRDVVEYFKDKPVRFLYICNEKNSPRDPSEAFMKHNNIKGEHIYLTNDEWNFLAKKFQFIGIPFCVLVDRKGNIVTHERSKMSRSLIEKILEE